jgi:tRNA (mo5U34)-methyltransferase
MEAITAGVIDRARELKWYHSLELTPDYVTEGMFDLRDQMDVYGLPARLDGMRCLDIGTWDGFWAFEMERRGAAEVIALDLDDERELDWPPRRRPAKFNEEPRGSGFRLAKEQFDSKVERVIQNIYTATPEELGTFDLVFCGSVMIHLRDQYLALNRIADLCSGLFISAEEYDRPTSLIPRPMSRYLADRDKDVVFWLPNLRCWESMLRSSGFDRVERRAKFKLTARAGWKVPHVVNHAYKH